MFKLLFALAVCLVGFGGSLFLDPIWGLVAFTLFTHITPQQLSPEIIEPLRLPLLLAIWTLVCYLINANYTRKFSRLPVEVWLLLFMLGGMYMGTVNAVNPQFIYDKLIVFGKFIIFYLLIINILNSKKKIRLFLDAQCICAAWLVYRCWDLRERFDYRFENFGGGVIEDSNHYAAALVLLMPIVIRRAIRGNAWIRIGAVIGTFGMIMAIIITGSRGAFLGLVAQAGVFFFFYKEYRKRIFLGLVGLMICVAPFITDYYVERMVGIFNPDAMTDIRDRSSAESRIESWTLAWETWQKMPLAGCGIGNFRYYMGYYKEGLNWGELGHVAHSLWLQILGEGGLAVFIPFCLILFFFYKRMFQASRHYRRYPSPGMLEDIYAIKVSLTGFLVCATFINRLFYEPIYWFSGLAVAFTYLVQADIRQRRHALKKVEMEMET